MVPYSKEGGWNIPAVGRWVGVIVVATALLGGAYDLLWAVAHAKAIENEAADRLLLQGISNVWRSILALGSSGVIIFLLAEIIDRLTWNGDNEEAEEGLNKESQNDVE